MDAQEVLPQHQMYVHSVQEVSLLVQISQFVLQIVVMDSDIPQKNVMTLILPMVMGVVLHE